MSDFWDSEFNTPKKETEYRMPKETSDTPLEETFPAEDTKPREFNEIRVSSDKKEEKANAGASGSRKEKEKKKLVLKFILGTAAATTILSASLGIDILGGDIFGKGEDGFILKAIFSKNFSDSSYLFPSLPNPDPDFNGDYAWGEQSPETSEEYLRLISEDGEIFLVAGGYYRNLGIEESTVEGCSYDRDTNTLTLDNFSGENCLLDANLMGNGFKIRLVGENRLGSISIWGAMYGGSLTLTGTGSLTVNETYGNSNGIALYAEESRSCLMIDSDVTIKVWGSEGAVIIYDTTDSVGLYYLSPLVLNGGEVVRIQEEKMMMVTVYKDGTYAEQVSFEK